MVGSSWQEKDHEGERSFLLFMPVTLKTYSQPPSKGGACWVSPIKCSASINVMCLLHLTMGSEMNPISQTAGGVVSANTLPAPTIL